jgi:hypothetical protein
MAIVHEKTPAFERAFAEEGFEADGSAMRVGGAWLRARPVSP